jgi:hypothetical protein
MAERLSCKQGVTGSNPVVGSKITPAALIENIALKEEGTWTEIDAEETI